MNNGLTAHAGAGLDPAKTAEAAIVRTAVVGWLAVALTALGLAGIFAFLLALSRVPGIEPFFPWPVGFFGKGLVIHVVFSFVVWFLAVFAVLATLAARPFASRPPAAPWLAPALAALALPLLFVPALLDRGEATLNNYIPVIIDPLYYAGLVVLAIAVALPALRLLRVVRIAAWRRQPVAVAIAAAAATALAALVAFAIAGAALAGTPVDYAFNEHLMWGGGHILQFLNTILAIAAWGLLAQLAAGTDWTPPAPVPVAAGLLKGIGILALLAYAVWPPFSVSQMQAFTWLQYALGPLAAVAAAAILLTLPRPVDRSHPAIRCLLLSLLVFGVGGALGLFVDGADTRTPAHYHGVIAGVSLALMGVILLQLVPALSRRRISQRRTAWIFGLFGWGQLAACVGLFVAGGHGAPRKVAGAAQGLSDLPAIIGMGLNGAGALVAIIGGIVFIWTVAAALLQPAPVNAENPSALQHLRL
jgi:hypothetical protein